VLLNCEELWKFRVVEDLCLTRLQVGASGRPRALIPIIASLQGLMSASCHDHPASSDIFLIIYRFYTVLLFAHSG